MKRKLDELDGLFWRLFMATRDEYDRETINSKPVKKEFRKKRIPVLKRIYEQRRIISNP